MQRAVFPSSGRVFAFQDGGFCRYPSTSRRRQTGRPNARLRTGCIARRTSFFKDRFKSFALGLLLRFSRSGLLFIQLSDQL